MKKLYKFLSLRDDFFDKPKIRLSQRIILNDPFECLPPADQVARLYNRIGDSIQKNMGLEKDADGFRRISDAVLDSVSAHFEYTSLFDHYGIVSLSQNYESILMWSHYSSQHTGIVIEIDISKLGLKNQITHSRFDGSNTSSPYPVIYTNNRKIADNNNTTFNHLFDSYMVKAEQWSYEKEYRIIANLTDATEVLIPENIWNDFRESKYGFFFNPESTKKT